MSSAFREGTIGNLLETYLVRNRYDLKVLEALSEDERKEAAGKVVTELYKSLKERSKSQERDFREIEKTRGDIQRLSGFDHLSKSINFLTTLYNRNPDKSPKEILALSDTLTNLIRYKREFTIAFQRGDHLAQMLYNNIVHALVSATSFTVSTMIDYVKDEMGFYSISFKERSSRERNMNLYFNSLSRFNKASNNGRLNTFFKNPGAVDNLVGSATVVGIAAGVIMALWAIIFILREIIYQYYYARDMISQHLENLAKFVQLNTSIMSDDMKATREKQEKIVQFLLKLSDRIAVDQKVGAKKAQDDISKEDSGTNIRSVVPDSGLL